MSSSKISDSLLKKYSHAIKTLEDNIKSYNKIDLKHKGYLLNLDDYNNFKNQVNYEANKLAYLPNYDIKENEKKLFIKDPEIKSNQQLINMLLNKNKYIIVDPTFYKIICEKGKSNSETMDYVISNNTNEIHLILKEQCLLKFYNKGKNNIIEESMIKNDSSFKEIGNIIQIEQTSNKREKIINKPNINNVKIISECVPNYNNLNVDGNIVKINKLERKLKEVIEKNKKLIMVNKNLKEANIKLNMENEKLKELKKEINKLNNELNQIKELKQKMENDLAQKDIEIQKLLSKKNKDYYDISDISALNKDDKIIAVNFVSMGNNDIGHYNLMCINRDLFVRLEERLYNKFPQFKNYETYFEVNGKRIKRFKTLEQNNIKNNDIINIFIIEE